MLLLALDTCDSRGSIALLDEQKVLGESLHPATEDFSSWLLPAVDALLSGNRVSHTDLGGYAVASGPGSFTGVRVGLTTAKAWAEVYEKPIYPVSRLRVLAQRAPLSSEYVAAFIDAQRKQVFAAVYRRHSAEWALLGEERVIDPTEFFRLATQTAGNSGIVWVTLDPEILMASPMWNNQIPAATPILAVQPPLASSIGLHALEHLGRQETDAIALDANYVRRSDAEIFGKKVAVP